jgi:hypothetical protein
MLLGALFVKSHLAVLCFHQLKFVQVYHFFLTRNQVYLHVCPVLLQFPEKYGQDNLIRQLADVIDGIGQFQSDILGIGQQFLNDVFQVLLILL